MDLSDEKGWGLILTRDLRGVMTIYPIPFTTTLRTEASDEPKTVEASGDTTAGCERREIPRAGESSPIA